MGICCPFGKVGDPSMDDQGAAGPPTPIGVKLAVTVSQLIKYNLDNVDFH